MILRGNYYSSFANMRTTFENAITAKASSLGLSASDILVNRNKAKAPYISIRYRPTTYDEAGIATAAGILYHKMSIYTIVCVPYDKDLNCLTDALHKAGEIEKLCFDVGLQYVGQEEGVVLDLLSTEQQKEYYLICEMYGYYRNTI